MSDDIIAWFWLWWVSYGDLYVCLSYSVVILISINYL